jgi:ribose transport system permease protein
MLVATGSTFIILARELDLSIGGGVALTSVVAATVMVDTESVWAGLGAGLFAGVGLGLVNGLLVTRIEVPAFIATLGTAVIARGVAISMTDGGIVTGLPNGFIRVAAGSFLGLSYIVWLMIITVAVLMFVQTQTTFGYRVFAVGGNPEAARLAGIPVLRVKLICFLIGGATITLAGLAMLARVQSGQPNGATSLELYAIAAIVMGGTSLFGGRGSVLRTISGVLLIVILQNGLDLYGVGYDKQQIVIGVVFIGAASVDFVRRKLDRNATRKTARRTSGVTSSSENA